MPSRVPMKISLAPSEICTAITSSPASTPMAMMPPARGLANAESSVFLIVPCRVPMTTWWPSSNSRTATIAAIFSPGLHLHQVGDRLAAAVGADVGDLVDLEPVDPAAVGEDHHVGVRRGDEEVVDHVLLAGPHADPALAAAPLVAVGRDRRPLDVAGVGDRDRHVLVGDQILDAELALVLDDLGAARVAELVPAPPSARRR